MGTREAVEIGLLDAVFGTTVDSFGSQVRAMAERLARTPDLGQCLQDKRRRRARDEGYQAAQRLPQGGARAVVPMLPR